MIPKIIDIPGIKEVRAGQDLIWQRVLDIGEIEILGFTKTGLSSSYPIEVNESIRFNIRNYDGSLRYTGKFSIGNFPDFQEDGWIETHYDHSLITSLVLIGKQLKTLSVSHLPNAVELDFRNNHITTVVATSNANLEVLNLNGNPLSSISGIQNTKINYLDLRNTVLPGSGISSVLGDLVNTGVWDGSFLYSIAPSESGRTSYDILTNRNWELLGPPLPAIDPEVNILTPMEGQEIIGDLELSWELLNISGINILTPLEGAEVVGNLELTFELT